MRAPELQASNEVKLEKHGWFSIEAGRIYIARKLLEYGIGIIACFSDRRNEAIK